jgi:hypothetical protein
MVIRDPLDFSFLPGRDYVYAMKDIMSTLFRAICFPYNGKIVTIDQLSFVGPHLTANHLPSLNGPYVQVVSPPPQFNYVATYPTLSTTEKIDPLITCSYYFDLDPTIDMVISPIGLIEPDFLTPIVTLDMYPFQNTILLSNEDLLEAMIEACPLTYILYRVVSSWKP